MNPLTPCRSTLCKSLARRWLSRALAAPAALSLAAALAACDPLAADVCGAPSEGNNDVPPSFPIEMGATAGTFAFAYETRDAKDRVEIFYEGTLLFDSGCVGESRTVELSYGPGSSSKVDVVVSPRCAGSPMTSWRFEVGCPANAPTFAQQVDLSGGGDPPARR